MPNKRKKSGISLTEILVVISIMAVLMGVSIPAAKQLMGSFESSTGTRQLINAALSNARAIAVRSQTYAGVRFQEDINGNTYIIFIEHDKDATNDAQGFRAVTGRKPMKLPEDVSVLASVKKQDGTVSNEEFFSVVFSPAGKLTTHEVQCLSSTTNDTIFNTAGTAMFGEDLDSWFSVQSFIIGSKKEPTLSSTEYISPYTGELVMEYRD